MKKICEEKFSGSPDVIVNASLVSIGLNIFLLIFGAFYTISTGVFITCYGKFDTRLQEVIFTLTLIHLTGVHKRLTLLYKHITLKNKCEKVL